jgi:hypothetical protein
MAAVLQPASFLSLPQLQKVPAISVKVFEYCDGTVGFLARLLAESHPTRAHLQPGTLKVLCVQEEEDTPASLVTNPLKLFCRCGL